MKFHVAAWVLGMLVLTPLWALIEWQDNGGFERFSDNSQPGSWEPWILYIGGVWAAVIALLAVHVYITRGDEADRARFGRSDSATRRSRGNASESPCMEGESPSPSTQPRP